MNEPHHDGRGGPQDADDIDVIAQWIREHPEVWADASTPTPASFVDGVVADIVSGSRMARVQANTRRRQRKLVAGGVLSALVVAGGAVGVAAIVRSGQPTQPSAGIACFDSVGDDADVIVVEPTDNPVAACSDLWATGRFAEPTDAADVVPALVACISESGVISVYPGDDRTCAQAGLVDAEPMLDPQNQAIVALQQRITDDVNLAPCATVDDVAAIVQRLVDESGLAGWEVEIRSDSVGASCAKAAIDVTTRVVQVVKFP